MHGIYFLVFEASDQESGAASLLPNPHTTFTYSCREEVEPTSYLKKSNDCWDVSRSPISVVKCHRQGSHQNVVSTTKLFFLATSLSWKALLTTRLAVYILTEPYIDRPLMETCLLSLMRCLKLVLVFLVFELSIIFWHTEQLCGNEKQATGIRTRCRILGAPVNSSRPFPVASVLLTQIIFTGLELGGIFILKRYSHYLEEVKYYLYWSDVHIMLSRTLTLLMPPAM